jgi:hypothetical protein
MLEPGAAGHRVASAGQVKDDLAVVDPHDPEQWHLSLATLAEEKSRMGHVGPRKTKRPMRMHRPFS